MALEKEEEITIKLKELNMQVDEARKEGWRLAEQQYSENIRELKEEIKKLNENK